MPAEQPTRSPTSASWKVNQPAAQSVSRSSQNRAAIALGFGSRKRWMSKTSIASSQPTRTATRTTSAGTQSRHASADAAGQRPAGLGDDDVLSALSSEGASAQQLAELGRKLEEARLLACVVRARLREVDLDDAGDPSRPGLITTTRVERNTASAIEWVTKTTVEPRRLPDPQQLEVQPLARHLVERAERLVHQQQLRVENESARAIETRCCIPPESCQG